MLSTDDLSSDDLSSMTKAQLMAYAEERGIGGISSSMTKAQIIEIIGGESGNA